MFVQGGLSNQTLRLKQADNQDIKRPKLYQIYIKEGVKPFFTSLFNGFTVCYERLWLKL